jgi:hypothetical protein
MRSSRQIPENPWPHEMAITVDAPNNILELLFIRSAWGIVLELRLPALVPAPFGGSSSPPSDVGIEEWSQRWHQLWGRAWLWYERWDESHIQAEKLRLSESPARFNPEFQPPFWEVEYGHDGIDREALAAWREQLRLLEGRSMKKEPERVCLPALIPAWQSGLTTVITLPYAGYFAERILKTHLVVSNQTREDPDSYSRALRESTR